jgi:hypothetical protein
VGLEGFFLSALWQVLIKGLHGGLTVILEVTGGSGSQLWAVLHPGEFVNVWRDFCLSPLGT